MTIHTIATWEYDFPCWSIHICPGFFIPIRQDSDNHKMINDVVKDDVRITCVNVTVQAIRISDGVYEFQIAKVTKRK